MYHPKKGEAFYSILLFFRFHMYYPNTSLKNSVVKFIQWFLIRSLTIFNFVGMGIHLFMSIKSENYYNMIPDLAIGLGFISIFIGLLLFQGNHVLWAQFLRDLTDFEKFEKPKNYDKVIKIFNMMSMAGTLYALIGIYLYVRLPIVNHEPCQKFNELHGLNEVCGLPCPFWWPNELTPKQKWIICIFQTISLALSGVPAMQVILFPVTIVQILKMRIDHFCDILLTIFDDNSDEDKVKKRLRFCVEYHQFLIKLGTTVDNLIYLNFSFIVSSGSVVIALILTQILQIYNLGNVAHVCAWIGGIFINCQNGQRLEDMFSGISDKAYFTKWYETTISNRRTILILMMRHRKPLRLRVIPCGKLNYEMFLARSKATYSFLTLMTQYK
nr:odorant receptor 15 [Pachyrhinus yasumatsui]